MIRLVVIEDHHALREGMALLLEREGISVVGTAGEAPAGYELVRDKRPDVALVDIQLQVGDGIDLATRLLAGDEELGVVLYTGRQDAELFYRAIDSGARGYALKGGSPDELLDAIRTVAAGGTWLDPRLGPVLRARPATPRPSVLTPRELEMMGLLATGLTGEEIAVRLTLSPETIRTHVRNAMEKLGARTRAHAIAIAVERGDVALRPGPAATAAGETPARP